MVNNRKKVTEVWAWGDFDYKGKYVVFDHGAVGGYKCKLCSQKLQKRKEILKTHLIRSHDLRDFESLGIVTIKEKCEKCEKPLDPHPTKMKKHLAKSCDGIIDSEEGEGEESDQEELVDQNDNVETEEDGIYNVEGGHDRGGNDTKEYGINQIEDGHDIGSKDTSASDEDQSVPVCQCVDLKNQLLLSNEENMQLRETIDLKEKEKNEVLRKLNCMIENFNIHVEEREKTTNENGRKLAELENEVIGLENEKFQELKEKISKMEKDLQQVESDRDLKDKLRLLQEEKEMLRKESDQKISGLKEGLRMIELDRENHDGINESNIKQIEAKAVIEAENRQLEKQESEKLIKKLREKIKSLESEIDSKEAAVDKSKLAMNQLKEDFEKRKEEIQAKLDKEKLKRGQENHKLQFIKDLKMDEVKIGEKCGEGNFGTVYKAKQENKSLAIKISKEISIESLTEAIIMLKLTDVPNVMGALGIALEPSQIHIGMDLMESDLNHYLAKKKDDRSTEWRRRVIIDTARGVKYLHQKNIIHCDIKPHNCLVKIENNLPRVSITDFGSANIGLEAIGHVGTPGYVAPEMFIDPPVKYTCIVDEWSLGSTLFEVLTGEELVVGDTIEEEKNPQPRWNKVIVNMPLEVKAVKKLLVKNPKKRKSAADLLKSI